MLALTDIQKLQFSDKDGAERNLLDFLKNSEDSSITKVELQPKPESLNSLNGFITYESGERYFFKTHSEEQEKLSEYYNAEALARAGYPVVTPKQISHKPGRQIVLYEILTFPTLFDLFKAQEDSQLDGTRPNGPNESAQRLLDAEIALDQKVFEIYSRTLQDVTAEKHAAAPIHQLFYNRLAEDGRLGLFYREKTLKLDKLVTFEALAQMRWIINGVEYSDNLQQIIERSRALLAPQAGPAIVGHGDAHNGNIFVAQDQSQFYMFDPAFAGLHNPLLDLTKPLFHNIFARWMYYPREVQKEFDITFTRLKDKIVIEHTYAPSAIRQSHLQSRLINVLRPTIALLKQQGMLDPEWRTYMRSALFCCPFLTVNLFNRYVPNGTLSERYELQIKLLGLAMAIEFGSSPKTGTSTMKSLIDEALA